MTKLTPLFLSSNGIPELETRLCQPSYSQQFNEEGLCIFIRLILFLPLTADHMFTHSYIDAALCHVKPYNINVKIKI